jgi:hypothetical protein
MGCRGVFHRKIFCDRQIRGHGRPVLRLRGGYRHEGEYAARAGTRTTYSFGSDETVLCGFARFADLDSPFGWRTSLPQRQRRVRDHPGRIAQAQSLGYLRHARQRMGVGRRLLDTDRV